MHGNALEWCRDFFREDLPLPGGRDPEMTDKGPGKRTLKVARGGNFADDARSACSHSRWCNDHDERNVGIGFRVALSPVPRSK
jgi:formylglycine-generating enzyme required for sulfatase activity